MFGRLLVDFSLLVSGAALGVAIALKAAQLAVGRFPTLLGMGPADYAWAATLGFLFAIAVGIRTLLATGDATRVAARLPRRRRGRGWVKEPKPLPDAPAPDQFPEQSILEESDSALPPARNAEERRARVRLVDPGGSFL